MTINGMYNRLTPLSIQSIRKSMYSSISDNMKNCQLLYDNTLSKFLKSHLKINEIVFNFLTNIQKSINLTLQNIG